MLIRPIPNLFLLMSKKEVLQTYSYACIVCTLSWRGGSDKLPGTTDGGRISQISDINLETATPAVRLPKLTLPLLSGNVLELMAFWEAY